MFRRRTILGEKTWLGTRMTTGRGRSLQTGSQRSPQELLMKNRVRLRTIPATERPEIRNTFLKTGQKGTAWSRRTVDGNTLQTRAEGSWKRIAFLKLVIRRGRTEIHLLCHHRGFLHLVGIPLLQGIVSQLCNLGHSMIR